MGSLGMLITQPWEMTALSFQIYLGWRPGLYAASILHADIMATHFYKPNSFEFQFQTDLYYLSSIFTISWIILLDRKADCSL